MRLLLEENKIKYIYQANKKDLLWLKRQSLDFYLPDYNIAIECQGEQHFKPVDFAGKGEKWAKEMFLKNQKYDKIKKLLCKENNLELLYYSNCSVNGVYNDINSLIKCIKKRKI